MSWRAPAGALLEQALNRLWWRSEPGLAAWLLWPASLLYRALAHLAGRHASPAAAPPAPVVVVGNIVVGGAGKTPVVIALVRELAAAGRRPGVISRGHGRASAGVLPVTSASSPRDVGDEPLLIHRRTGVPVFVGRERSGAATALCAAHPQIDVIVCDDGLQHRALARVAEIIVFDDRGIGNGLLLPAGPLRQPMGATAPRRAQVVYTGSWHSTAWPGSFAPRTAGKAIALADWVVGAATRAQPLTALRGRPLTALAGIGAPEQFFAMLEAAGLQIEPLPMRDHADYAQVPWPATTCEVVTTEKDAVKLAALPAAATGNTTVWVLPLDCQLPRSLVGGLLEQLPSAEPLTAEPPTASKTAFTT